MEEKKIEIPEHIWQTACTDDAYFEYHRYLRNEKYTSNHDAWEALERERESWGLPMRYTTFESFKTNMYKWVKDKMNKK